MRLIQTSLLSITVSIGALTASATSQEHTLEIIPSSIPFLVSLPTPANLNVGNVSHAGRYDAEDEAILWGPFDSLETITLSFQTLGADSPIFDSGASIQYAGDDGQSEMPTAGDSIENYVSWLFDTYGQSGANFGLSGSQDLDGDHLTNALEYLMGLNLEEPSSPWEALIFQPGSNSSSIQFRATEDADEYTVILKLLDYANGSRSVEFVEGALSTDFSEPAILFENLPASPIFQISASR